MDKTKGFPPQKFQECTIRKIIEELFKAKRNGPKRFLVADEVGLGKTIVARHVINHLRRGNERKIIIYVSSSLDITKQNRAKLAEDQDKEVIHADRINLLYELKGLGKGVQIVSMTPGTSLDLGRGLGSAHERRYIATLVRYYFGGSYERMSKLFHGPANYDKFLLGLRHYRLEHDEPRIEWKIKRRWEQIKLESGHSFQEALRDYYLEKPLIRELIKKSRKEMAVAILESLDPDLIIFDEFQKFREITEMDAHGNLTHELGRILLTENRPTLLLSATPYRLFTGNQITHMSQESTGHYQDLERTFTFLTGSHSKANGIVNSIQRYGDAIQNINENNIRDILALKSQIQEDVMKFMSRAERINFEGQNESHVRTIFLSDQHEGGDITKENILEFLKLSAFVTSNKSLLTYWKSGAHSMSYLDKYKLIEGAMNRSETKARPLRNDKSLYSPLKEHSTQHIKLKYLYKDILKEGEAYGYLWLPPTRPYYDGEGLYSEKKIAEAGPKKGLVFSSWMFIPKMVAAELGAMRKEHFKRIPKEREIKPSGDSWAKLFFPSTMLANVLSHKDFIEARSHQELHKTARHRIENILIDLDYEISAQGKSAPIYSVLNDCEFHNDPNKWKEYRNLLKGHPHLNISPNRDKVGNLLNLIPISMKDDFRLVHPRTIDLLAKVAISSPSVVYLRSINYLRKKNITYKSWLQLSSFCINDIRSFINRPAHIDVILRYGKAKKLVDKAFNYFKKGNFQAVIDEYLYQIFTNKTDAGVFELLKKLSQINGPTKAYCEVKTSPKTKPERVTNDIICCFGDGAEQSHSRDLSREAFNSPFWPFVLTTTSVGQEGLDFHLYCNDIYHWNLPTNPVDFEQREGRLNRFNNYMIRKNIVLEQKDKSYKLDDGEFIWDLYLDNARKFAQRSDRYNLGMSPNWVFTPHTEKVEKLNRHILDLPCSNDRDRYDRLMQDLDLYRLALGQPNQREFMERLRNNTYYRGIDPRGIILNFFPSNYRDRSKEILKYFDDIEELDLLIHDCFDYLKEIGHRRLFSQLAVEVERHVNRIRNYTEHSQGSKKGFKDSVKALYYFVDPFDYQPDRDPEIGFEDDLRILRAT